MNLLTGQCSCGNIQMTIETVVEPRTFASRQCDCDFCVENSVSYFSDAEGSLNFEVKDRNQISRLRQGSETAEFLKCTVCGKIAAVTYQEGIQIFASVNANLITRSSFFLESVVVSPKTLSKENKIQRWKELWFKKVKFKT